MSMPATLALRIVVMFMLVGVGFAMFRAGKITMEGNRTIGNILVYLSLPCVIIKGLMVERTAENVAALGVSALMGFVALLVSALVARLVLRGDAIGNFSATCSTPSFFGIPLVVSSLGQEPVFYMTAYIAFMNLGQWTYGVSLLTGERGRVSARSLVRSPFMVATLIGLVLFATQLQLPGFAEPVCNFSGHAGQCFRKTAFIFRQPGGDRSRRLRPVKCYDAVDQGSHCHVEISAVFLQGVHGEKCKRQPQLVLCIDLLKKRHGLVLLEEFL